MFQASIRRVLRPLGAAVALTLLATTVALRVSPTSAATRPALSPQAPSPAFDQQFIDMMAPHHQGAVAMAQIALTRAPHPQIQSLARSIIADQNSEIARMKAWRTAGYGSAATPGMADMPMLPGMTMGMGGMSMMRDIGRLKTAKPFDNSLSEK